MNGPETTRPSAHAYEAEARHAARVALVALLCGLTAGLFFTLFAAADIAASSAFHREGEGFLLANSPFWQGLRWLTLRGYTLWYVTIVIAGLLAAHWQRPVLGFDAKRWLYLALCSLLGPGLLTNAILKDYWGRWRPREIVELGGTERFTTPFDLTGTCLDNCSFVSGEVSSMVMVFAALAFAAAGWRWLLWPLTVAMGALAALLRVGQGGHFLSDSILAGVFMVLVAAALYWAMFLSAYALAGEQRRRAMHVEWLAAHDRFWSAICDVGLKWLDRVAPRR